MLGAGPFTDNLDDLEFFASLDDLGVEQFSAAREIGALGHVQEEDSVRILQVLTGGFGDAFRRGIHEFVSENLDRIYLSQRNED